MLWTRLGLVAGVVATVVTTALTASPATAAQSACGRKVLAAWSKGSLQATYPLQCYRSALQHLPADVRAYSSATDDIQRALLEAIGHGTHSKRTLAAKQTNNVAAASTLGGGSRATAEARLPAPLPLLVLGGGMALAAGTAVVLAWSRRHA